ncbi:MAG: hypothetical protein K8F91_07775 [Candidatus Obscuribacterales bacterium]|nr:hypothetical protein [Candidatus Obscuribacterales bacterium]
MLRDAPEATANAFVLSRLSRAGGYAFGTLPATVDTRKLVDSAYPFNRHLSNFENMDQ